MMTKVELTRFRIKKGKEEKAQEWMDFLNDHHTDTVATMAGEKMYVESVFKEKNPDGSCQRKCSGRKMPPCRSLPGVPPGPLRLLFFRLSLFPPRTGA